MERFYLVLFLLLATGTGLLACEDEKDSLLMDGKCGMTGMKVECLKHSDCLREGTDSNYCTIKGRCTHDMPGVFTCWNRGTPCLHNDKVCGHNSLCTYPCETHADCPDTNYCYCTNDGSYCMWARCGDDGCGPGFHSVEGTLYCIPDELAGECYGPNGTCPDGFVKVGEWGPGIGGAACVADASPL